MSNIFNERLQLTMKAAFGLALGTALRSSLNSAKDHATAKRHPLRHTLLGSLLYLAALAALVLPKVHLAAVALSHAPYWLPVTLLAEICLVIGYLTLVYGANPSKEVYKLSTWRCLLSPGFLAAAPNEAARVNRVKAVLAAGANMPAKRLGYRKSKSMFWKCTPDQFKFPFM